MFILVRHKATVQSSFIAKDSRIAQNDFSYINHLYRQRSNLKIMGVNIDYDYIVSIS